ncbi:MAG: GIY-YIG nuclease family protein [Candidatus Jacksonbacteria bacterium]|jgi:putative endonuclease|nr:GIY-YIG nuclease family protein [Candidatus Jacksonbacteria bacterium]
MKTYCVYIVASRKNGTIYVGVTSNLVKRLWEHNNGFYKGFTKKYKVNLLVYYEIFEDPTRAIEREKQLKNWKRAWKIRLIEDQNPLWRDLYETLE